MAVKMMENDVMRLLVDDSEAFRSEVDGWESMIRTKLRNKALFQEIGGHFAKKSNIMIDFDGHHTYSG